MVRWRRGLPVAGALTILRLLSFRPRRVSPDGRARRPPRRPLRPQTPPMTDGSLTKAALIQEVAHAAGLTRKRAEIIVDTVFGSIVKTLHRGEKVELRGFGSFRLRRRGPHGARNPRTGDLLQARQGVEGVAQPGAWAGRTGCLSRDDAGCRPAAVILADSPHLSRR